MEYGPKTIASDTAPTSGLTTSTTPNAMVTSPVTIHSTRSPAVMFALKANTASDTPLTIAHAAIHRVSASAVIDGHSRATTPAAADRTAATMKPSVAPALPLKNASMRSVAAIVKANTATNARMVTLGQAT